MGAGGLRWVGLGSLLPTAVMQLFGATFNSRNINDFFLVNLIILIRAMRVPALTTAAVGVRPLAFTPGRDGLHVPRAAGRASQTQRHVRDGKVIGQVVDGDRSSMTATNLLALGGN